MYFQTAIDQYSVLMKARHRGFSILKCGLHIHPEYPFIAATPDSLVKCDCCGTGVLEVKCPFTLAENGNEVDLPYISENGLKKNHAYYYQVIFLFKKFIK